MIVPDLCPPASEFGVLYNVPRIRSREEGDDGEPEYWEAPDPGDGTEWVHIDSVSNPPEIDDDLLAKYDAYEVFVEYLVHAGFPMHDELGNENYSTDWEDLERTIKFRGEATGQFEPMDRTLEIPLIHEDMFTPTLVERVQQKFFPDHPLWRIHVCATLSDGEESLMIYPDVARVGERRCPPGDLAAEMEYWRREIATIRDRTRAPRLRQFREVVRRLPEAAKKLKESEDPFVFLVAFNNWRGQNDLHSLWLLQRESDHSLRPAEPAHSGGDSFHLSSSGCLGLPEYSQGTGRYRVRDDSGGWDTSVSEEAWGETFGRIVQYSLPAARSHEVVVRGYRRGEPQSPDGREWTFSIVPQRIMSDAE